MPSKILRLKPDHRRENDRPEEQRCDTVFKREDREVFVDVFVCGPAKDRADQEISDGTNSPPINCIPLIHSAPSIRCRRSLDNFPHALTAVFSTE